MGGGEGVNETHDVIGAREDLTRGLRQSRVRSCEVCRYPQYESLIVQCVDRRKRVDEGVESARLEDRERQR